MTQKDLASISAGGSTHCKTTTPSAADHSAHINAISISLFVCIEGALTPLQTDDSEIPERLVEANARCLAGVLRDHTISQLNLYTRRLSEKRVNAVIALLPEEVRSHVDGQQVKQLRGLWSVPAELRCVRTAPETPIACIEHAWTPLPNWTIPWTFLVHPYFGLAEAHTDAALAAFLTRLVKRARWRWK